jgi:hypothetical protein
LNNFAEENSAKLKPNILGKLKCTFGAIGTWPLMGGIFGK